MSAIFEFQGHHTCRRFVNVVEVNKEQNNKKLVYYVPESGLVFDKKASRNRSVGSAYKHQTTIHVGLHLRNSRLLSTVYMELNGGDYNNWSELRV